MSSGKRKRVPKETNPTNDDALGISRLLRDVPPAHFTFKVESFSILSKTNLEKLESDIFEAGGYKWRLTLYPNGNTERNGNDHISLYLVIADTKDLPRGWEIFVSFKLFVFDHINDKFLAIQDVDEKVRRFTNMNSEWGFHQLLPLSTFNDVSNGYLDLDSCIFGAEVFVHKYSGRADCVSLVEPKDNTYTWTVDNFSMKLENGYRYSDVFTIGGQKWKLCLYPKGAGQSRDHFMSLYLQITDWVSGTPVQRLYAKYKLRIMNQISNVHVENEAQHWFNASSKGWGFSTFLSLNSLNDTAKGYRLKDVVILQAEFKVMAVFKNFS